MEDNPSDVQLFELALAEVGLDYSLLVIEDGGDALSWVEHTGSAANGSLPDLAVVDLNLPKYGGLDVLARMRAVPVLSAVPVLVLSSSASPRDIAHVRAFPHTVYITKP